MIHTKKARQFGFAGIGIELYKMRLKVINLKINLPKREVLQVDQTDRQLLAALKHNSRASITQLAADLGVSRVTVKSRMASLRANGIIRRFTIDVSDLVDQDIIHAVSLLELQLAKVEKVHRSLKSFPEISSLHTTNGKWAVVARSETQNLAAFDMFLNRLGKLDGVSNVETCLLLTRLQ